MSNPNPGHDEEFDKITRPLGGGRRGKATVLSAAAGTVITVSVTGLVVIGALSASVVLLRWAF